MLTIDGYTNVITDHVSHAKFRIAREKRDSDANLQHQPLVLIMLPPMVIGRRLQFVDEAVPVFSPSNRLCDTLHRSACRPWVDNGDPESGDGEMPTYVREDDSINGLARRTKQQLETICRGCCEGARGSPSERTVRSCPRFVRGEVALLVQTPA